MFSLGEAVLSYEQYFKCHFSSIYFWKRTAMAMDFQKCYATLVPILLHEYVILIALSRTRPDIL